MSSGKKVNFESFIIQFVDWLKTTGVTYSTLRTRTFYLTVFCNWCGERGITEPEDVTRSLIDRYQKYVSRYKNQRTGKNITADTQIHFLVAVKVFFLWLQKKGHVLFNPTIDIQLPRQAKRLPRNVLTVTEVEKILSEPNLEEPLGVRDRAILELFYSTGIRRFELENLKIRDIDFASETLFVREGKGKKDRLIPVARRALDWIEKYLGEVRIGLVNEPDEGFLFLNFRGGKFTSEGIGYMVTEYRKKAGIKKEGSTHMFRHTTATLMLENGADIRYVQQMLGHSDLSSTQIYTHVAIRKLKEVHENTHPSQKKREVGKDNTLPDTS